MRKFNFFLRHGYSINNFPVITMPDAGQRIANKSIFENVIVVNPIFLLEGPMN